MKIQMKNMALMKMALYPTSLRVVLKFQIFITFTLLCSHRSAHNNADLYRVDPLAASDSFRFDLYQQSNLCTTPSLLAQLCMARNSMTVESHFSCSVCNQICVKIDIMSCCHHHNYHNPCPYYN